MSLSEGRINSEGLSLSDQEHRDEFDDDLEDSSNSLPESIYLKNLDICKRQFKFVSYAGLFWIGFLLLVLGLLALAYVKELITFDTNASENIIASVIAGLLVILSIFRIVGNLGFRKQFAPFSGEYAIQMPDKPNHVLRDLYVALHCKRCVHFWLTFLFQFLTLLSALYTLIGAGISSGVSSAPKIFTSESWTNFFTQKPGDWSMWMVWVILLSLLTISVQYVVMNQLFKGRIRAMEEIYGREKLVNDCLLSFKVNEINKRYKIFVFVTVCVLGCVIYIFFRKMICSMFDKSFSV